MRLRVEVACGDGGVHAEEFDLMKQGFFRMDAGDYARAGRLAEDIAERRGGFAPA
jgi:hypothetical protein